MRREYFQYIVVSATLFLFAVALPCQAQMQTIQKGTPATKPGQNPLPMQKVPQQTPLPGKTPPTVKQPEPAMKAFVYSISMQEKRKKPVRVKDKISLKQGATGTIVVTGKNLDLIDKIDVTVKVISSSPTTKKISLTANDGGTYQVKFRAGTSVVKTVSVKINIPEKVYRTAKKPVTPAAKPPVAKAAPKSDAKVPAQPKKPTKSELQNPS
jgi:hypothetical protein